MPERELGKKDLIFTIRRDGRAFGRLHVSKGALVWKPENAKKYGYQLSWRTFAELAEQHGDAGHK